MHNEDLITVTRLPENAFPSASIQFVEAVRGMMRDKASQRDRLPKDDYRRHFKWHAGPSMLQELLRDPLQSSNLHRANWASLRPRLFVSVYLTQRDDELVVDVLPTAEPPVLVYLGPFRQRLEGDPGDFQRFSVDGSRDYWCPILKLRIDADLTDSDFRDYRQHGRELLHDPRLKRERHLCALLVRAKLHQLSLHFDVSLRNRLVEYGENSYLEFRSCGEMAPQPKPYLSASKWVPARLWNLLQGSGLDSEELYKFAATQLSKAPSKQRVSLLAEYLANSHTQQVTEADVRSLLKLLDENFGSALRLKELETEPLHIPEDRYERMWYFERFARDAGLEKGDAFDWLLKFHPEIFETLDPPSEYLRKCMEPVKRGVWRLDDTIRARLDAAMAGKIEESHYRTSGRSAVRSLDWAAKGRGFDTFAELRAWADKHAPLTAAAAARLEVQAHREIARAKEASNEKRRSTMAKRKAAEKGGTK
ncbi:hypothetical protein [Paraburkholderia sp. SIMBA_054]|uniref:hypothetical protein n=1 Tax=Paraburkholderia sp. SIMBA_054 TaxID=3085795 RepID=UPI00397B5941